MARERVRRVRRSAPGRGEVGVVKNREDVSRHISRIFAYSAIKIKANLVALYSTLNPETSSDSPSAKSNGVRCVSARMEINQIMVRGKRGAILGVWEVARIVWKSNEE